MSEPFDFLKKGGSGSQPLDATPVSREVFLGYIGAGYKPIDAVAEYIDNSFEWGLLQSDPGKVRVEVSVRHDGAKFFVEVFDNAGGCRRADAALFVRPGAGGMRPRKAGIGRFGTGGKAAGLSIAKRVVILSKAAGDAGFKTILDAEELTTKTDWKFQTWDLPVDAGLRDGQTKIFLYDVSAETYSRFPQRYVDNYSRRYALLLSPNNPKIVLGGTELTPRNPVEEMLTAVEAPRDCRPRRFTWTEHYKVPDPTSGPERQALEFDITVGLLPERSTTGNAGARIYCNGRLVGGTTELGLVEGFESADQRVHPYSDRAWLRAIVQLRGPVELMPWTNRKDGLNASADSYPALRDHLRDAYKTFLDENIAPLKREIRQATRRKGVIDISRLLEDNFRAKITSGELKQKNVRLVVANTNSFKMALRPPEEMPPSPSTPARGTVLLAADVETKKLNKAKRIIRQRFEHETVRNVDVVRIVLDHFLSCVGEANAEDEDLPEDERE